MRFRCAVLVALTMTLVTAPRLVPAQSVDRVYRVGVLGATSAPAYAVYLDAFRQGLRDLGYVEGKNLTIETRWADGRYERLAALATELIQARVDVIVTHGPPGSLAAKRATSTVPIVMAVVGDAVAVGLITSLSHPGGNITGSTFFWPELSAKRLQLLKEAIPGLAKVAVLSNPANPNFQGALREANDASGRWLGVGLIHVNATGPNDIEAALAEASRSRADALLVPEDAVFISNAGRIASIAARHRLKAIGFRELAESGGLMAFGVNFADLWRRAATFVDKILKGARAGDLPVERPSNFEVIVNLKTARALGVTIPQSVLVRADKVIE